MEYIDITKLKFHDRNPRKIDKVDFEHLKKSISEHPEFFDARPILANPQMEVFAGNMRLRAAKELGLKEVPCIIMDISEEKQNKLMILDNRNAGKWDFDILASDFQVPELLDLGFTLGELGMGDTGKDAIDVDNMAESLETYMNSDIRQVVLYFKADDHTKILARFDALIAKTGAPDYSALVEEMLTHYENTYSDETGG